MKLIVQIPVLNEADSIAEVLADIPRVIAGVDSIEVLIVDDGCTDNTVAMALSHGADHVMRHTSSKGVATTFQAGIDTALRLGADIIVSTDGDHQYPGGEIPHLIAPILAGRADYVIGDRQVDSIEHFSPLKKTLQAIGSGVVRWASDTEATDAFSGFWALSREAALRTFVTSDFSYTAENLIQAGKKRLTVATIPIATNRVQRPSRLHRGNWNFIKQQSATIVRTYVTYEPLKTFTYLALPFLLLGAVLLGRAIFVFLVRKIVNNYPGDNVQSLVGSEIALILGFVIFLFGILADRIGGLRRLLDEVLYHARSHEVAGEVWRRDISARLDHIEQALLRDRPQIDQDVQARERGNGQNKGQRIDATHDP